MDGNGRWAKKKLFPRLVGHNKGLESVRKVIEYCIKYNIKTLTIYAFSTENWKRPIKEVDGLLKLFSKAISKESKKIHSNNIRLKFIGDTSIFTEPLQLKIKEIEKATLRNNRLVLNVALNYGGRLDIVNSVNKFYENKKKTNINWIISPAEKLPFEDNKFDFYSISFGSKKHKKLKQSAYLKLIEF